MSIAHITLIAVLVLCVVAVAIGWRFLRKASPEERKKIDEDGRIW